MSKSANKQNLGLSMLPSLKRIYASTFLRNIFEKLPLNLLFFSTSIDYFIRYKKILSHVEGSSVLDVGCGGLSAGIFLPYPIVGVDISSAIKTAKAERMRASASFLPFKDNAFSYVITADMIEHIPRLIRPTVYQELKRVGNNVILICPIGKDARRTDFKYYYSYKKLFGKEDSNIIEHLNCEEPTFKELNESFPNATWQPSQNTTVSYILFLLQKIPMVCFLTGIIYQAILKRFDSKPPFYDWCLIWKKTN